MDTTHQHVDQSALQRTVHDFFEDADEILYLVSDAIQKIHIFKTKLKRFTSHLFPETVNRLESESDILIGMYTSINESIRQQMYRVKTEPTVTTLHSAYEHIETAREQIRTHQLQLGALLTCTEWQSPSYAHTLKSQAGIAEGTIEATINDYKRDRHNEEIAYEKAFKRQYIDGLITFPVNVYATTSGMAAFSTILSYLVCEGKLKGTVLIGSSIYFECKILLTQLPNIELIEVDESDADTVLKLIDKHQPSVVVFDSIANMPSVAVVNLDRIVSHLVTHSKKRTILVVDNTCRSIYFQPIPHILGKFGNVSLIVFESLNKYHQFGMDRVTGGIIWCYGGDTGKISNYRVHTGTNIPDIAAATLPTPNRKLLTKKLQRHGRNATYMAQAIHAWIASHPTQAITTIVYPQLPNHPSYSFTKTFSFSGSFITLKFSEKYSTIPSYKRFIRFVLTKAAKRNISLIAGTSFGLHTTRIYLTAIRSEPTTPFVRISVGTEHFSAMQSIVEILIQAISQFK